MSKRSYGCLFYREPFLGRRPTGLLQTEESISKAAISSRASKECCRDSLELTNCRHALHESVKVSRSTRNVQLPCWLEEGCGYAQRCTMLAGRPAP